MIYLTIGSFHFDGDNILFVGTNKEHAMAAFEHAMMNDGEYNGGFDWVNVYAVEDGQNFSNTRFNQDSREIAWKEGVDPIR